MQTKTEMGEVLKTAMFGLAEAKFTMGDFNQHILANIDKSVIKVRSKKDNVAGVQLPIFEAFTEEVPDRKLILDLHCQYSFSTPSPVVYLLLMQLGNLSVATLHGACRRPKKFNRKSINSKTASAFITKLARKVDVDVF